MQLRQALFCVSVGAVQGVTGTTERSTEIGSEGDRRPDKGWRSTANYQLPTVTFLGAVVLGHGKPRGSRLQNRGIGGLAAMGRLQVMFLNLGYVHEQGQIT